MPERESSEEPALDLTVLATRDDIREEGARLRQHITMLFERQSRQIHALIDAIELMKQLFP